MFWNCLGRCAKLPFQVLYIAVPISGKPWANFLYHCIPCKHKLFPQNLLAFGRPAHVAHCDWNVFVPTLATMGSYAWLEQLVLSEWEVLWAFYPCSRSLGWSCSWYILLSWFCTIPWFHSTMWKPCPWNFFQASCSLFPPRAFLLCLPQPLGQQNATSQGNKE